MKGVPVRRAHRCRASPRRPRRCAPTDLDADRRPAAEPRLRRGTPAPATSPAPVMTRRAPAAAATALLPVLRAENARGPHPPRRPQVRRAAGRQHGLGQVHRPGRPGAAGGATPAAPSRPGIATPHRGLRRRGWWSEPLEQPLTCALDDDGRMRRPRRSSGSTASGSTSGYAGSGSATAASSRSPRDTACADRTTGPTDLSEGSVVCVPRRAQTGPGRALDLELVEVLAWQISEGCETTRCEAQHAAAPRSLAISQGDVTRPRAPSAAVCGASAERYGLRMSRPRIDRERAAPTLVVQSADWRDFLKRHGYRWGRKSREKAIPDFVMQGDLAAARVFLRAFADAEGSVAVQHRTIELDDRLAAAQRAGPRAAATLRHPRDGSRRNAPARPTAAGSCATTGGSRSAATASTPSWRRSASAIATRSSDSPACSPQ